MSSKYYFNSFRKIRESKMFPHSRTLRTGFLQKILDTFTVFFGQIKEKGPNKQETMGLVSYITTIPLLLTQLLLVLLALYPAFFNGGIVDGFVGVLLSPVALALAVGWLVGSGVFVGLHYLASALLTLAVSPIVAFVHVISLIAAYHDKKMIGTIAVMEKVIEVKDYEKPRNIEKPADLTTGKTSMKTYPATLAQLMQQSNCDLEDIQLKITKTEYSPASKEGKIEIAGSVGGKSFFWIPKENEKDQLKALMALNIGGINKAFKHEFRVEQNVEKISHLLMPVNR